MISFDIVFTVHHVDSLMNKVRKASKRNFSTKKLNTSSVRWVCLVSKISSENTECFQLSGKFNLWDLTKPSKSEFKSPMNASFFTRQSPIKYYFPICQPHLVASGLTRKMEQASGHDWVCSFQLAKLLGVALPLDEGVS